jgi:tetratricopeptide (TPR) repeat protein
MASIRDFLGSLFGRGQGRDVQSPASAPFQRQDIAQGWCDKGDSLVALGRPEEGINCYDKALEINPRNGLAWYNKAGAEECCGRGEEAAKSYRQFVAVAGAEDAQFVAVAK